MGKAEDRLRTAESGRRSGRPGVVVQSAVPGPERSTLETLRAPSSCNKPITIPGCYRQVSKDLPTHSRDSHYRVPSYPHGEPPCRRIGSR